MKLSLEALKERAEAVASQELLDSISGGIEEACHDDDGFWRAAAAAIWMLNGY
jgi:hypothetical protein